MTEVFEVIRSENRPLSSLRLGDLDGEFTNPRTEVDEEKVYELALEIVHRGVLNSLLVTEDGLVVGGSRRYRALRLLQGWPLNERLLRDVNLNVQQLDERARILVHEVPVRIVLPKVGDLGGLARLEGIALADNLHRVDLSSYEIAAKLTGLHVAGATGAQLARLIGKSASYVSRKLSTWRNAGPDLHAAWKEGMAEDGVITLSGLPVEEQVKVLAGPVPRGRRGPAHRPSVDMVRDFLDGFEKTTTAGDSTLLRDFREQYRNGILDALRWVTGNKTSEVFAKIAQELES